MASLTRTLSELRSGVADVADVAVAVSGRHTNTLVNARINKSIHKWYRMIAECGADTYLKGSVVSTVALTGSIVLGEDFLFLRGLDVYDGSTPITMMPLSQEERNDLGATGFPRFYRAGPAMAAGAGVRKIQLFPAPDAVYSIGVYFIPAPPTLVNDADIVETIAGGEQWIINDAAMQTLANDGLVAGAEYQALRAENMQLRDDMRFALSLQAHTRKLDTVGRRDLLRNWSPGA
jgi:hypothetical protein